ncbi:3D domain-containing protein [Enterococcus canintestini]|uniref:Peptidase M23 n=1 Tax=Enterococcus canintestini TaxID=317010 RepID=A0A267HUG8_9ENTE|nr:3D domain-containing protein [Enterococcus canintestini]PAB01857.1 peptidase M23 [Enterococcus canintestini]
MKAKKLVTVLTAVVAINLVSPVFAAAESLDSLNEQESTITRQSNQISAEVQMALNDVNDKYDQVEKTKAEIAENEATLQKAQKDIEATKVNIAKRKEVMAQRLKEIQVNGGAERDWSVLLDAKNLQEFINRAYAMTLLQNAQKQKVADLNIEKEKLEKLEATVQKTTTSLKENKVNLETEASELDGKIANLKQQLADNQSTLQKIAQSKEVETARLAAEKAAKEKAAAEKAAAEKAAKEAEAAQKEAETEKPTSSTNNSSSNSSGANSESSTNSSNKPNNNGSNSNSNNSESNTNNNTNNNGGNSSSGGRTLIMESTAYSYAEAGASYLTASGTDLRENPQAVAVDPSVIPLGTVVEVQGYGVALALDTGGAIKGNIIDVHFPTVAQCTKWGRRQVQVTIRG